MKRKKNKKGIFIVLEGTDGTGKTTQHKLLVKALRRWGLRVSALDFPQYGRQSAYYVEQYLNGVYGPADKISPYLASLFYALDRYAAKEKLIKWLAEGRVVVVNRYTLSNAAHQGGKIKSTAARQKYWRWLFNLEYGWLGLPRPDLTIILHIPAQLAQALVLKKAPRGYLKLGKKRDAHEINLSHLKSAEARYLTLARLVKAQVVECVQQGRLLTPAEVHSKLINKISKIITSKQTTRR